MVQWSLVTPPPGKADASRDGAASRRAGGRAKERAASPTGAEAFGARLVEWFSASALDHPWRRTEDPYRIWVAEVLLQQTRVEQALPYYERFLRRFPTVRALALAEVDDVLKMWEGAGYYGRARRLHAAAREIVDRFHGHLPSDPEVLSALPGFGPYTSRSVAALAYGRRAVALDANALRVLARVFLLDPGGPTPLPTRAERQGLIALGGRPPRAFNEALMELGQRFCTARAPRCPSCPVGQLCAARRRLPDPGSFPPRERRAARPRVEAAVGILLEQGRVLMGRRPENGLLGGLWEFPGGKLRSGEAPESAVVRELREETGRHTRVVRRLGTVEHDYSHFHATLHVFLLAPAGGPSGGRGERAWSWIPRGQIGDLALPVATRKMLPWVDDARGPPPRALSRPSRKRDAPGRSAQRGR